MRCLYIMHSQYNLILALGIISEMHNMDKNYLVLNSEFVLTDTIKETLNTMFCKIIYTQEYYFSQSGIKREFHLYNRVKMVKDVSWLSEISFDRIYMSQEEYFDTWVVSHVKKSEEFKLVNVEEDIYFSRDVKWYNLKVVARFQKRSLKQIVQKKIRFLLYGKNDYYEDGVYFYGQSSRYDFHFVLFPNLVRLDRRNLNSHIVPIKPEMLRIGIDSLYIGNAFTPLKRQVYCVFFLDLLERYSNLEEVKRVIENIINGLSENVGVYIKYHPRETNKLEFEKDRKVWEIPNNIAAEKVLVSFPVESTRIIGNTSCAIQVAARMGFETISISSICGETNIYMLEVMKKMGISLLTKVDGL